jgi:hypothetical protein
MRSKNILSTIAFITAFAFSSAFALLFIDKSPTTNSLAAFKVRNVECRQDAETKNAIESLLRQDIRNGQERFWRINDSNNPSARSYYERYAESVEHYADDSGSINYSHLPRDFQLRWNEHMRAWRDYSNYLNKAKNSSLEDEDFYQDKNEYLVDINSTWYSVLRVGKKYCAEVSQ